MRQLRNEHQTRHLGTSGGAQWRTWGGSAPKAHPVLLDWAFRAITLAPDRPLCFPVLVVTAVVIGEGSGTHSSTPAWKTPWTEEPGGLQSMGL